MITFVAQGRARIRNDNGIHRPFRGIPVKMISQPSGQLHLVFIQLEQDVDVTAGRFERGFSLQCSLSDLENDVPASTDNELGNFPKLQVPRLPAELI